MKRDFDLIRRILHDVEQLPAGNEMEDLDYDGEYDEPTVYAHVNLLIDAEFLKGEVVDGIGADAQGFYVFGLTWKGHDFLDAAKDDTIWAKAKSSVLKPTASFTFDILLEWLKAQAKEKLGLP